MYEGPYTGRTYAEAEEADRSKRSADVLSLQDPERGSFAGDEWGEHSVRFTFCAVAILSLLGRLDALDTEKVVRFIANCRNFDGGFGMVEGAESHAAYGQSLVPCLSFVLSRAH